MKAPKYATKPSTQQFFLIPVMLLGLMLSSFHKNSTEPRNDDKFIVVLDAGHGGHDPGNLGNGYYEKNIALNIVLKAGELLEKNPDIEVIYTRKDDTFVDLYVRGEMANKAGADLFVSVHCDSHTSQAHGAGTFVLGLHANKQNFEIAKKENSVIYLEDDYKSRYADYDIDSPESVIGLTIMQEEFLDQSIALAKDIQDNFANDLGRTDRKVKQAGFIVLHQTFMPSVLVETGFLTNKEEGAYLDSKKGQSQMGTAMAEAIMTYKESAMANMADFDPGEITSAPDPDADSDAGAATEQVTEAADGESGRRTSKKEKRKRRQEEAAAEREAEADPASSSRNTSGSDAATDRGSSSNGGNPAEVVVTANPNLGRTSDERPTSDQSTNSSPGAASNGNTDSEESDILYKVQIMASAKDFPLNSKSFNGLNRVSQEPYKNLYRYVYGSTSSLREAKMLKSNADIKGYPSSFIVVYRNGERITFAESKEYIENK